MSRQIDLSKPLSDEDKQYLIERNRGHLIPEEKAPKRAPAAKRGAKAETKTEEVKEEAKEPVKEHVEENEDDDKSTEYSDMSDDELKALLEARELPADGDTDELIARLAATEPDSEA